MYIVNISVMKFTREKRQKHMSDKNLSEGLRFRSIKRVKHLTKIMCKKPSTTTL